MPIRLVDALREILADWQDDLPADWRAVLADVELGFGACDPELMLEPWEPVFPARRGRNFPGAPKDAHIFRALDGIAPQDVRCVILGQDPYPAPDFSTGRAFEAGNISAWRELDKMFSKSVRAYMQMICAARSGQSDYARSFEDWPRLLGDIESGAVDLERADMIAARWVGEGVLLLNSSLTLSRFAVDVDPHQSRGHLPVWRPFMLKILSVVKQAPQPVVFMAFGDAAQENLRLAGLMQGAASPLVICRPHPAEADNILAMENPFLACNRALEAAAQRQIAW